MVDWDRVEELHAKGWSWDQIAEDPKVGFHADTAVRDPGRALRGLYHKRKSRQDRQGESAPAAPSKKEKEARERKWTLVRVGYLATPIFGLWALLAYIAPSPVGILLPAVPWLALAFAASAFVLLFGLWRSAGPRWNSALRSTVVLGVVAGLLISGVIGLTGYALFGCPYLSPALGSTPAPGWGTSSAKPWQENGLPVFYFYGATWCPYCSASSWAMWKALTEFQSGFGGGVDGIPGTVFQYSSPTDAAGPSTPEVVMSGLQVNSPALSYQVSEYFWNLTTGTDGTFPGTSNCVQAAYVAAYSGGSIPFLVLNGQYVHGGSTIISPSDLSTWSDGANGGYSTVATDVLQETGTPWTVVQGQAAWICAYLIHSDGYATVAQFLSVNTGLSQPAKYQWTTGMTNAVNSDLTQL
jgi:hypothetical protein